MWQEFQYNTDPFRQKPVPSNSFDHGAAGQTTDTVGGTAAPSCSIAPRCFPPSPATLVAETALIHNVQVLGRGLVPVLVEPIHRVLAAFVLVAVAPAPGLARLPTRHGNASGLAVELIVVDVLVRELPACQSDGRPAAWLATRTPAGELDALAGDVHVHRVHAQALVLPEDPGGIEALLSRQTNR